jgi:hypothetical protein
MAINVVTLLYFDFFVKNFHECDLDSLFEKFFVVFDFFPIACFYKFVVFLPLLDISILFDEVQDFGFVFSEFFPEYRLKKVCFSWQGRNAWDALDSSGFFIKFSDNEV